MDEINGRISVRPFLCFKLAFIIPPRLLYLCPLINFPQNYGSYKTIQSNQTDER